MPSLQQQQRGQGLESIGRQVDSFLHARAQGRRRKVGGESSRTNLPEGLSQLLTRKELSTFDSPPNLGYKAPAVALMQVPRPSMPGMPSPAKAPPIGVLTVRV